MLHDLQVNTMLYGDCSCWRFIVCLCLLQKIQEQRVMHLLPRTTCQTSSMCCIPAPLGSPSLWKDYEKVWCDPHQLFLKTWNVYIKHDNDPLIIKCYWRVKSQTADTLYVFNWPQGNKLDSKSVVMMEIFHQQNHRKMTCYHDDCS